MKLSKVLKILGIILLSFIALVVLFVGFLFYKLPTGKELGKFFTKDKASMAQAQEVKNAKSIHSVTSSSDTSESVQHNDSKENNISHADQREKAYKELNEFTDEKNPLITFCNKLDIAKTGKIDMQSTMKDTKIKNVDGSTSTIKGNISFDQLDDLRFEAIKPLFKTIFRQPEMKKLVAAVLDTDALYDAKTKEDASTSIAEKYGFYKQAYSAYTEMKDNIKEYEAIVDRGYLMYKLNDLVALKPELKDDPRIQKYCENNEYLFNSYTPLNFENEKADFERIIQEMGVSPSDIKYDHNYKTKLDLKFSGTNLQMQGGWLSELISDTHPASSVSN